MAIRFLTYLLFWGTNVKITLEYAMVGISHLFVLFPLGRVLWFYDIYVYRELTKHVKN